MTPEIGKALRSQASYHMRVAREDGSLYICCTKKGRIHLAYDQNCRTYLLEDRSERAMLDSALTGRPVPVLAQGARRHVAPVLEGLYIVAHA